MFIEQLKQVFDRLHNLEKRGNVYPPWIAPTLLNGWVNYGTWANAGYTKHNGVVHIRGLVKSGTVHPTNGVIFTLPAGYRPSADRLFVTIGNALIARLDVFANGNVVAVAGSNVWFSIETSFYVGA